VNFDIVKTPTVASASVTQNSVTININRSDFPSQVNIRVYRNSTLVATLANGGSIFTENGLTSGTQYTYTFKAEYQGTEGPGFSYTIKTIPSTPSAPTGMSSRVNWSSTVGRSKVVLNWMPVVGANGYKVWVFDGNVYRAFDVGNTTAWDSSQAKIYPDPNWLASQPDNSISSDLFNHAGGGFDLQDNPNILYRKTVGTTYDSASNYWFRVSAYNESGESPVSEAYMPTLPNATDSQQPSGSLSALSSEGLKKTYNTNIQVTFNGLDTQSGIYRIGLSNDNTNYTYYPYLRADFDQNEEEFLQDDRSSHTVMSESGTTFIRVTNSTTDRWHGTRRAINAVNLVPGQTYYLKICYRTGNLTTGTPGIWSHWDDASGGTVSPNDYMLTPSSSWKVLTFTGVAPANTAQKHFIIGFDQCNVGAYIDVDYIEFGLGDGSSRTIPWTVTPGAGTKTIYLRIEDCVGNQNVITDTIALAEDMLPPSITLVINGGADSTISATVTLTITAQDNASVSSQMQMRFSNDGNLWSAWEAFQQTKSWDITNAGYGGTSSAGIKKVYVQVCDLAQNVALAVGDIGYNPAPPSGSVSIVGGSSGTWNGQPALFTKSDSPTLNLNYSGATQVRFDPGAGMWGDWVNYASQITVYLIKSQGACRLRVQVKDAYGVAGTPQEFIVVVDPTPPTIQALRGLAGATATRTSSVALEITASDNLPGTLQYSYQVNGGSWSAYANLTGGTITVLGLSSGVNIINVSVKDLTGNASQKSITIFKI